MSAKEIRKNPLRVDRVISLFASSEQLRDERAAEARSALELRVRNALEFQADPRLPWKITLAEIRQRANASNQTCAIFRHRLLTSVSTDSELQFLDRLYQMARVEARHIKRWAKAGNSNAFDVVSFAGQPLDRATCQAYRALMQLGYQPGSPLQRVEPHSALLVQMVFELIGLYKKGV